MEITKKVIPKVVFTYVDNRDKVIMEEFIIIAGWLAALLTCTGFMYAGVFTMVALFYVYFTGAYAGQCKLHEFYISFNMILCVGLSIVSVLPKVIRFNVGLLPCCSTHDVDFHNCRKSYLKLS